MDPRTITELGIGIVACAVIFYSFRLMLGYFLSRFSGTMERMEEAIRGLSDNLNRIEMAMTNRDQIILNHLEHFQETQLAISELLKKLCKAWEINNGR